MNPEQINPERTRNFKQEYLNDFIDFRQNCLDVLPPQTVEQYDPNLSNYKCRGNFFFGVCGRISNLINEGLITNSETLTKAKNFMEYAKNSDWEKMSTQTDTDMEHTNNRDWKKMSTQGDIDKVNVILDLLIKELS